MGLFGASLEKLSIYQWDEAAGSDVGAAFEVMFNPKSYVTRHGNSYLGNKKVPTPSDNSGGSDMSPESSQSSASFLGSKAESLELSLTFDGTGTTQYGLTSLFSGITSVKEQVLAFLSLCVNIDESTHMPNCLRVQWGIIDFRCRLKSNTITYNLFDKAGEPLRAEMSVVFEALPGATVTNLGAQELSSPDLTHTHMVTAGDTLPLLVKNIYGSSKYYLQIARINKLDNFRQLEPGQTLLFPPLEQSVRKQTSRK